jgi:hypothetical protein
MLILRETSVSVAEAGVVFETQHVLRLWSNIEVRGLESRAHFVGRVAKVLRHEDSFRSVIKLGPRQKPHFLVHVASIAANPTLDKTFRASVALHTKKEVPYVARTLQVHAATTAPAAVTNAVRAQNSFPKSPAKKQVTQRGMNDVTLGSDRAEEYGRSQLKGKKESTEQNTKKLLIVAFVLALAIAGIWLGMKYGTSEKSVYGDSFQKLFESKGK